MEFVVDTNVLFSFFRKGSLTRHLLTDFKSLELSTPSFCLEELSGLGELICEKAAISEAGFREALDVLQLFVRIVPEEAYSGFLPKAKKISPDPDDVDFFALALKLGCRMWSNDKKLKEQSVVGVLTTPEVAELVGL